MGKAKKLKISKAPRNTPLEENITKVSAVYIKRIGSLQFFENRMTKKIADLKLVFQNFGKIPLFSRYYFHFKYILTDLIALVNCDVSLVFFVEINIHLMNATSNLLTFCFIKPMNFNSEIRQRSIS